MAKGSGSKKNETIKYVAIIAVLIVLVYWLFLGPAMGKVESIKAEIDQEKVLIEEDLKFLASRDRIEKESRNYQKYFTDKVEKDTVVNGEFISKIEQLAREAKVNLIKSSATESKKATNSVEYYAELDCSGSLDNVIKFMHLVNGSEDLLKIVQLKMSPKRGTANDVSASMTLAKLVMLP